MKRYIKSSSEDFVNKLIKKIDDGVDTCFIIQTEGDNDYWYWVVDTAYVTESGLTDEEFINDVTGEYGHIGFSSSSFDTVEDAIADYNS